MNICVNNARVLEAHLNFLIKRMDVCKRAYFENIDIIDSSAIFQLSIKTPQDSHEEKVEEQGLRALE